MTIALVRTAFFVFIVTLIAAPASARAVEQGEAEKLIRETFPELSIRQNKNVVTLEVCFDLCDVFQWRGSRHSRAAWDFVAAYEYKKGVGTESDKFKSAVKGVLKDAVTRLAPYCKEDSSDSEVAFDCSWHELAKSKGVRVGSSKYDEGQRCFGWRDLTSKARPNRPHCRPFEKLPWEKG
jgi:hypothetical protein